LGGKLVQLRDGIFIFEQSGQLSDPGRRQIQQCGIVSDQTDADFIRFIFEPADFHKLFWRSQNFPTSPAKVESKFQIPQMAASVAQSCTLPYRRFSIGKTFKGQTRGEALTLRRIQFCDTADYKSALRMKRNWLNSFSILTRNVSMTA
jgi:hypothetical protein